MYAIRGNSWRAINTEADLLPGETLSLTAPPTVEEPVTEVVFSIPVRAPDFVVASPKPKDNPKDALAEAIAESKKPHGATKSMGLMVLSMMRYIEDLEKRVAALEKK